MIKMGLVLGFLFTSSTVFAQQYTSTVTDVTVQYESMGFAPDFLPTPTPTPDPSPSASPAPTVSPGDAVLPSTPTTDSDGTLGTLITLGTKIWEFIISNKPNSDYGVLNASVVPEGLTNWTQLSLAKSKTVAKVYHVEFTNMFGGSAGGFDYRITYMPNASYKGKGKYLAQISVVPMNTKLKTDRTLKMKAELLTSFNYGTEEDPIAGAHIFISWSTPTTTRYEMSSAEYVIHGSGEIEDLTNGN